MVYLTLVAAVLCGGADDVDKPREGVAPRFDLTKIKRTIRKEPEYRSRRPWYSLVVFGPRADFRVWVVFDGNRYFVDRNGNGDLTEDGESAGPKDRNTLPRSFEPITLVTPDGKDAGTVELTLWDWLPPGQRRDLEAPPQLSLHFEWNGKRYGVWGQETGKPKWGSKPENAPIYHVEGALQMGFEQPIAYVFRRHDDEKFEIYIGVGTKGLGESAFTHLSYFNDAIPKGVYPTVDFEFPNKTPGGPPVTVRAVLKQRC